MLLALCSREKIDLFSLHYRYCWGLRVEVSVRNEEYGGVYFPLLYVGTTLHSIVNSSI